jgi:catalase
MDIRVNKTAYEPNSLDGGWPKERPVERGGFASYLENVRGDKRRVRAASFADHFSQATLFWSSQTDVEKSHIVAAFGFELAKVGTPEIRERVLGRLVNVDPGLAAAVAAQLGLEVPEPLPAAPSKRRGGKKGATSSPALSIIANATGDSIRGRKVAILAADGVDAGAVTALKAALAKGGAQGKVLAPRLGTLTGSDGTTVAVDHTIVTEPSVGFDAVFVPGGGDSAAALAASGNAVHFVAEAFKHAKAIGASGEGARLLREAGILGDGAAGEPAAGVVIGKGAAAVTKPFLAAVARHRAWDRAGLEAIPA